MVVGTPSTPSNAVTVTATITPNPCANAQPAGCAITDVILEFGRRPNANAAVTVPYSSAPDSYNLQRALETPTGGAVTLPSETAFNVTFRFPPNLPHPLYAGELVDYQFRVTHRAPGQTGTYFFWSQRHTLTVTAPPPPPPPPPPPSGGGGSGGCADSITNVSRPPDSIVGGTTTDLGGTAPSTSVDGGLVAFVSPTKFDPNAADVDQIYRRNLATGEIVPVTRPSNAIGGGSVTDVGGNSPSISNDGARVAFVSRTKFDPNAADNVDQVYVRDLGTGTVLPVSTPSGGATDHGGSSPVISGNGQFVAFVSKTKFDPNATDVDQIYRRNLATGEIVPVTRPSNAIGGGSVTDVGGNSPSISNDGARVAFVSRTKFDPNAADNVDQVYVRDLGTGDVLRVSTPSQTLSGGSTTDHGGQLPRISRDGRFVVFVTRTQFDANAPVGRDEIYRRCLPGP